MQLAVPVPPQHRSFPGASAGYPQRTGTSAPPLHRVSAQVSHQPLFDSPRDAPHSSGEHPSEQQGQPRARLCSEQGSRWGVLALHPASCLVHPAKEGRDRDKPRKGTTDRGARVAAETELLKPAETQHSCNTSTHLP